jgi:hypothetical protein
MSGFDTFKYNNNPIINSFCDIASINLPTTETYTPNQYNILAPTIDGSAGYVLQTNNNIISIDSSGGFSINNTGVYKISLCFSFDDCNRESETTTVDVMLNASPLTTVKDVVGTNTILNVNATGTALSFGGLTNNSVTTSGQISDNYITTGPTAGLYIPYTYTYFVNPNVMYCSDPAFFFGRYYLSSVNNNSLITQVLSFESTVNITSTSNGSNYFYPCICPYVGSIWNTGINVLPQPYLMVQMISSTTV